MFTGDTLELKAACSDGYESQIEWYSKNPEIADVDENGIVTAYSMGAAEITAKTDDYHEAVCRISVEDGNLRPYYQTIRENWKNRLTGNNIEDPSDEVYAAMMEDLTETAAKYWETMKKGGSDRRILWDDIDFTYQKQDTTANVGIREHVQRYNECKKRSVRELVALVYRNAAELMQYRDPDVRRSAPGINRTGSPDTGEL